MVGYEKQAVRDELQTRGDENIVFAEQNEQLGTGHAVQMCYEHLGDHDGLTLVIAGDSPLVQADSLKTLVKHFEHTRPALLLGTLSKANPTGLGRIVRDPTGEFIGIVEEKDATTSSGRSSEVNMSTYLSRLRVLTGGVGSSTQHRQPAGRVLHHRRAGVDAEARTPRRGAADSQDCESLSINNPEELAAASSTNFCERAHHA